MKTVSIMEAQHNLAKVLRRVSKGEHIVLTRHKKPIATLNPLPQGDPLIFPDFEARARKTWGDDWTELSTDELINETRGDR